MANGWDIWRTLCDKSKKYWLPFSLSLPAKVELEGLLRSATIKWQTRRGNHASWRVRPREESGGKVSTTTEQWHTTTRTPGSNTWARRRWRRVWSGSRENSPSACTAARCCWSCQWPPSAGIPDRWGHHSLSKMYLLCLCLVCLHSPFHFLILICNVVSSIFLSMNWKAGSETSLLKYWVSLATSSPKW